MNREDKIKLLQQVAKGNTSALRSLNKGIAVIFLDIIKNIPYWIDLDIYLNSNKGIQEIIKDNSIRKFTTNELKEIHKRRFVFATPPEMFYNNSESEKINFYNRYLK